MARLGFEDCWAGKWEPTYGHVAPRETLLTTLSQRARPKQVCEDLVFSRGCRVTSKQVLPLLGRGPYSHLSDHWGLAVELDL